MLTLIARVVLVASRMVWPSGADLATKVAPMAVPAPGPVVDHERLAEPLLQPPAEQPGHGLGPAAGRIGHDEQDRSRGVLLRGGRRGEKRRRDGERQGAQPHRFLGLFRVCRGVWAEARA